MRFALVLFALAALAVAQVPDPKVELAAVIAVEEQEGDLAKAEQMYRAALEGKELSERGRAYARLRLGKLLKKLGRHGEAMWFLAAAGEPGEAAQDPQGQERDLEREKELRQRAEELVAAIAGGQYRGGNTPLVYIDQQAAEQLLWLGESAVPAVIAALDGSSGLKLKGQSRSGLAGFLWATGGDAAAAFLASCAKSEELWMREAMVRTASQLRDERMLQVARKYLADPDESGSVVGALLLGSTLGDHRFDPDWIVEAALAGPPAATRVMLEWAVRKERAVDPVLLARIHAHVRQILQSTDPAMATSAHEFLLGLTSQRSIDGIALLLDELPRMSGTEQPRAPNKMPWEKGLLAELTRDQAAQLLPHVNACAARIHFVQEIPGTSWWLQSLMHRVAEAHGPGCEAAILGWIDAGYRVWRLLEGRVTADNAGAILDRAKDAVSALYAVQQLRTADSLPAALCERLIALGELDPTQLQVEVANAVSRTGNPKAADWLLAQWPGEPKRNMTLAYHLVRLGRDTQAENVRAALRECVAKFDPPAGQPTVSGPGGRSNARHVYILDALLALLWMGDEQALQFVFDRRFQSLRAAHPYSDPASNRKIEVTALEYLLSEGLEPQPGYTAAQIEQWLRGRDAEELSQVDKKLWVRAMPDRFLRAAGRGAWAITELARRSEDEEVDPARRAALGEWYVEQWQQADDDTWKSALLACLPKSRFAAVSEQVAACLDSANEWLPREAAQALAKVGALSERSWRERLARHPDPWLRDRVLGGDVPLEPADAEFLIPLLHDQDLFIRGSCAERLGDLVAKEAVPALIELLRDPEQRVRKQAADSLTKIRFYHEQQAHWDRVLKGLDASPASAAEKLLLQARPDQPRAQRLLALQSLGVLGVPEALPFLIEWANDSDAEVAAAAREAITQIHLNPRR